jgi:hypothetical protein
VFFADTGSAFVEAWKSSGAFLALTLAAFARHPGIILLYAAPPATERAWVLLRTKPVPAWWLPSLEALVVVWRVLFLAVAVWIVLPPQEMAQLRASLTSTATVQDSLDHLGANIGNHLWVFSWEALFFLIVFFAVFWLMNWGARRWIQGVDKVHVEKENERMALGVVARNLLLYPIAVMYGVVVIRHYILT